MKGKTPTVCISFENNEIRHSNGNHLFRLLRKNSKTLRFLELMYSDVSIIKCVYFSMFITYYRSRKRKQNKKGHKFMENSGYLTSLSTDCLTMHIQSTSNVVQKYRGTCLDRPSGNVHVERL